MLRRHPASKLQTRASRLSSSSSWARISSTSFSLSTTTCPRSSSRRPRMHQTMKPLLRTCQRINAAGQSTISNSKRTMGSGTSFASCRGEFLFPGSLDAMGEGTSEGRRPQASSPLTCDHIRAPDDAKIKDKMLFASSHEAFKHRLDGVGFEVQATDRSEVSHEIGSSLAPEDTVIS